MGNANFGSKATAGRCQSIIARMPANRDLIESNLSGSTIMKHKPVVRRSIGVDIDACAIRQFRCESAVDAK